MSIHATSLPSAGLSYVIASVYGGELSLGERQVRTNNKGRHAIALHTLKGSNIPHKLLKGGYRHDNGEYVEELSILFPAEHWARFAFLFENQKSVLILGTLKGTGTNRRATLHYLSGKKVPRDLGWFTAVSRDIALANPEGYTFDPSDKTYWICQF